jgi:hypothetical protein
MSSSDPLQPGASKKVSVTEDCCNCGNSYPIGALCVTGSTTKQGRLTLLYECAACRREVGYPISEVSVTETEKTPPVLQDTPCSDSVVERVVKKLRSRSEFGKKKYGVTLEREDLSMLDWINHTQEELMDAVNYLERLKIGYEQTQEILKVFSKLKT